MSKEFGRVQKSIIGILTFASVTSTVMTAMELLDGGTWATFNIAIILGAFGALSGGKAAQTWAQKPVSLPIEGEAP